MMFAEGSVMGFHFMQEISVKYNARIFHLYYQSHKIHLMLLITFWISCLCVCPGQAEVWDQFMMGVDMINYKTK